MGDGGWTKPVTKLCKSTPGISRAGSALLDSAWLRGRLEGQCPTMTFRVRPHAWLCDDATLEYQAQLQRTAKRAVHMCSQYHCYATVIHC